MTKEHSEKENAVESPERRALLAKAGKYAAVTPVAVTVLMSTSMKADAGGIFKSGGSRPRKGTGHTRLRQMRRRRYQRMMMRMHRRRG